MIKQQNSFYTFNIGLHFSLTSGTALTGESSLTIDEAGDDGLFEFHEAKNYPFKKIKSVLIQHELVAQLDLLDQWLNGTLIDHVTNHHGIVYLDLDFFDKNYLLTTIQQLCQVEMNEKCCQNFP